MSKCHGSDQRTGNLYTDQQEKSLMRLHAKGTHPPRAMSQSRPHPPVPLPQEEEDSHYTTIASPPPAKIRLTSDHCGRYLSAPMTLPEFVTEYSKQLPVQIKVMDGYCGPSSRLTISTNDMFNVHLVKRAKVVHITDSRGTLYSVPLNSSIEFGLVYDPVEGSRGSQEAVAGYTFRVCEMLGLDQLPKVICCLKECKEVSLQGNEQLVVKGIQNQKSRLKSKKGLKVLSLRTKEELVLPEDCKALFSTESGLVKMTLMDMVQYVHAPFPSGAMIHLNANIYQDPLTSKTAREIPEILISRMVDISEVFVETSLITSIVIDPKASYLVGYSAEELHQMIDIPLEGGLLGVQVAAVEVDGSNNLYEDTRSIYEAFSPHKVKPLRDLPSDQTAAAQRLFSKAVRIGWETHGIELDEPTYKYVTFSAKKAIKGRSFVSTGKGRGVIGSTDKQLTSAPRLPPRIPPRETPRMSSQKNLGEFTRSKRKGEEHSKGQSDCKENHTNTSSSHTLPRSFKTGQNIHKKTHLNIAPPTLPSATPTQPPPPPPPPPPLNMALLHTPKTLPRPLPHLPAPLPRPPPENSMLGSYYEEIPHAMPGGQRSILNTPTLNDSSHVQSIPSHVLSSPQRLEDLEATSTEGGSSKATPTHSGSSTHSGSCTMADNKSYLRKLTFHHVLDLLDAMELNQYKEVFSRERISGDVLLELGQDDLKEELGIHSKLHRIRLMKVITGQHSARNILCGVDPYS